MTVDERAHVDSAAVIGADANIAVGALIGPDVVIGASARIGPGAIVLGPTRIGDRCTIAAGCVVDPSSDDGPGPLIIEDDVSVLAGAAVVAKITIAGGARVETGTVVKRSVPPHAIVSGNPAQITGYLLSGDVSTQPTDGIGERRPAVTESSVRGVSLHHLPRILDLRGNLTVGEFGRSIPFSAKRYFMVFDVPNAEIRGEHAHRKCEQFLICARGSCAVVVDDGERREEYVLDDPATGIYLPALTWGVQYKYSQDAVLLVFASEFYDSAEYIREYPEFLELTADRRGAATS